MAAVLSDKSDDRRITKSTQAIRMALFRLLGAVDWSEITVSRICNEASIARSTFYLHYSSPTEVLDDSIARIVAAFPVQRESTLLVLDWLIDHIVANRAVFHRTTAGAQSNIVIERFKLGVMAAFAAEKGLGNDRSSDFRSAMIVGGAFQAIQLWAKRWDLSEIPHLKSEIRCLDQFACGQGQP